MENSPVSATKEALNTLLSPDGVSSGARQQPKFCRPETEASFGRSPGKGSSSGAITPRQAVLETNLQERPPTLQEFGHGRPYSSCSANYRCFRRSVSSSDTGKRYLIPDRIMLGVTFARASHSMMPLISLQAVSILLCMTFPNVCGAKRNKLSPTVLD